MVLGSDAMQNETIRSRWVFVGVMFLFLLFSQLMGFFIEPITTLVSESSTLVDRWFNRTLPIEIIFMMLFFLIWGVLFDRHSRKRLLSLAGFLWGSTAWLMGISPTFATFQISTAAFGISRASYSGIFALVGDLFKPTNRGKVLSLLLLAQPLAIVFGTVLDNIIELEVIWRQFLILFGAIGFLITLAIQLKIQEPKRGAKEPALTIIPVRGTYLLDWDIAKLILTKPSLILIYGLILLGTIPVFVLLDGMLIFLRDVHTLSTAEIYSSILPAMLGVVLGYPIGGFLGDLLFKFNKQARLIPGLLGSIVPPICLYLAIGSQDVRGQSFMTYILLGSIFMAFTLPNLFAMVLDVTLPEIRALASAACLLIQTLSILIAPLLFSFGQRFASIGDTILWICIGAWVICTALLVGLFLRIPKEIEDLRRHMAYRSLLETRLTQLEG
jgi:predicted MFS family arabinose efflux permease